MSEDISQVASLQNFDSPRGAPPTTGTLPSIKALLCAHSGKSS